MNSLLFKGLDMMKIMPFVVGLRGPTISVKIAV